MEHSLICNPNAWDAIQLLTQCETQIWDEIIASPCDLDPRREVIPHEITELVFAFPGYRLLARIEERVRESWRRGDMDASVV